MDCSPWRCLLALVVTLCVASFEVVEADGWTAEFSGADTKQNSAGFAVGDGRYVVSVALSGVNAEEGRLSFDGRELPADVFLDPISRLVVFRVTGPPAQTIQWSSAPDLKSGTRFKCPSGGQGSVDGWVKKIDGKILPLALIKVTYGKSVPPPGSALTDISGGLIAVAHQATGKNTGYALPIQVVKRVMDDIQRGGKVSRGWIGLKLRPGLAVPKVTHVQKGSPCEEAGVQAGDVLLEVGDRHLNDYADAANAFYYLRPGAPTSMRVRRGNQEMQISITPGEYRSK